MTMLERNQLVHCESFCNYEKERRCKSELFLRMADPSKWALKRCLQWCSSASKLWSFTVWILPHHATVAHGWITHSRPTRNAWATTFPFSSIESWGSWLTWRAWMTVALRASWTCCDKFFVWIISCLSWRGCTLLNQVTLNVSSVIASLYLEARVDLGLQSCFDQDFPSLHPHLVLLKTQVQPLKQLCNPLIITIPQHPLDFTFLSVKTRTSGPSRLSSRTNNSRKAPGSLRPSWTRKTRRTWLALTSATAALLIAKQQRRQLF